MLDRTAHVCGGAFAADHAAPLGSMLSGALDDNPERRGTVAALSAVQTALLVLPPQAPLLGTLLGPALRSAVAMLAAVGGGGGGGERNELVLGSVGALLARTVLCSRPLFSSAVDAVAASRGAQPQQVLSCAPCRAGSTSPCNRRVTAAGARVRRAGLARRLHVTAV